jgi:Asp/Glu/hydantoin racemase
MSLQYTEKLPKGVFGEKIGMIVWRTWYPALVHGHHNYVTTYDFPIRIKFIETYRLPNNEWGAGSDWNLPEYIRCARELEDEGVSAICTNCGLTGSIQGELADSVNVPVFTSSLMQVPFVARSLKRGRKVGILVAMASLAREKNYKMLRSCGIDELVPYVLRGLSESVEAKVWGTQFRIGSGYDPKVVERVMVDEALKMVSENPEVGAIVLECTEMPLYAAAVQEATGLMTFDSSTLVRYVHNAVTKNHYF